MRSCMISVITFLKQQFKPKILWPWNISRSVVLMRPAWCISSKLWDAIYIQHKEGQMEIRDIFRYSSNFQMKINISEKELRFQETQHFLLWLQHKQQWGPDKRRNRSILYKPWLNCKNRFRQSKFWSRFLLRLKEVTDANQHFLSRTRKQSGPRNESACQFL